MEIDEHLKEIGLKSELKPEMIHIIKTIERYAKNFELNCTFDTFAQEPLAFHTIAYSTYASGIIIYPQSPAAVYQYRTDLLLSKSILDDIDYGVFERPKDKYVLETSKTPIPKYIDKLVILCGSNALRAVVDREKLVELNGPETYVKMHPLTSLEDKEELKEIFNKSIVIDNNDQLYPFVDVASNIYTTPLSESVIYAGAEGKKVYDITIKDVDRDYNMPYKFTADVMFGGSRENKKLFLNKLLQSEISCFFHPDEKNIEAKIERYFKYIIAKRGELR